LTNLSRLALNEVSLPSENAPGNTEKPQRGEINIAWGNAPGNLYIMNDYKIMIALAIMMLTACSVETAPFQPQQIEAIVDEKELIKRMLIHSLTRLPNGMRGALVQRNFMGKLELVFLTPAKDLSEKCRTTSDCLAVIYASVSQTDKKQTKMMYRIYRSSRISCAWIETYDLNSSQMNEELITTQIQVRALEWVKTCFTE